MTSTYDLFDGADDLLAFWRKGLAPDPFLSVSEWADKYRVLSAGAAAEPGRYRTSRTPYMREIMDALSPSHPARRIVVKKSSQIGYTETANNWIAYNIDMAPDPMLAVLPSMQLAEWFSKERIDPLIADNERIKDKVGAARSRDSKNTIWQKAFVGGTLTIASVESEVTFRGRNIRYIVLDELDAFKAGVKNNGDPVARAQGRMQTYSSRSKMLIGSTPLLDTSSLIDREYLTTDQRKYFLECPYCKHRQFLVFERLRWEKGKPESALYHCKSCEQGVSERHKTAMLESGEWRPTAVSSDPYSIGFHINALYSPVGWLSWPDIARRWESISTDGERQVFKNEVLGETWVESGEAPDWQRLYDRREAWHIGTVPKDGLFLTAGVDVQKDRLECSVWAWGRGLESWLVEHTVIDGGAESQTAWDALKLKLNSRWKHENGGDLGILRMAIDTGYETSAVYTWARAMGWGQVSPVKGIEGFNKSSPVSGPTHLDATVAGRKIKRGVRLWTVAVSTFKTETYRFLRQNPPTDESMAAGECYPAGYVHLPHGTDEEIIKQLVAEQLVTVKTKRGYQRLEWQKIRARNEALDCRVYARAAAYIAGADRWGPDTWRDLEDQVAVIVEDQPPRPARQGGRRQRSAGVSIG